MVATFFVLHNALVDCFLVGGQALEGHRVTFAVNEFVLVIDGAEVNLHGQIVWGQGREIEDCFDMDGLLNIDFGGLPTSKASTRMLYQALNSWDFQSASSWTAW